MQSDTFRFGRMARVTARTGRELVYVIAGAPLGAVGFCTVLVFLVAGSATAITFVGLPILALTLRWAGALAWTQRWLAGHLLNLRIDGPPRAMAAPGLVGWLKSTLGSAARWRAVAYVVVKFPLAMVTLVLAVAFWGYGLLAVSYPAWRLLVPAQVDGDGRPHRGVQLAGDFYADTWPRAAALAGAGAVLLMVAPWVVRTLLALDKILLVALLGGSGTQRRVQELERTRAEAVDSAAVRLRRIERDLHDGPQAQLVAVAMRLGMVQDNLDPGDGQVDLARVRELVDNAHRGAKQTLDDLRQLARGIHPPILDSGLGPALSTLVAQSAVPVRLHVLIAARPSPRSRQSCTSAWRNCWQTWPSTVAHDKPQWT